MTAIRVCPACGARWPGDEDECGACHTVRLDAGVYSHEGDMHLVYDEMLAARGIPANRENLEQMRDASRKVFGERGIPVREVD